MGAICPPPDLKKDFSEDVRRKIILPVLRELTSRGIDFRGVLYAGLIITGDGPKVLEFNVRFGDPETQVVLPMIEDDLAELCFLGATGGPLPPGVAVRDGSAACVILASGGYPGSYAKGFEISGLEDIRDAIVFHAGTKKQDGVLVTAGGRVLGVTGLGSDLEDALSKAYGAINGIGFEGMYYRRDIGRTI
jgi:phosphoribosylamine--glycine ligase